MGNLVYLIWGSNDLQPWDAADFLKKRDVELKGNNPVHYHKDSVDIKKDMEKIS